MGADIPVPLGLAITSALLGMLSIFLFPQVFQETTLTKLFLLFACVNFGLWSVWKAFIYPSFFSPLRALPQPKVIALI
jgi:hypothetical protein